MPMTELLQTRLQIVCSNASIQDQAVLIVQSTQLVVSMSRTTPAEEHRPQSKVLNFLVLTVVCTAHFV